VQAADEFAGLGPIYRPSERLRAMAISGDVFYPA
jgi:hypothetical protein